MHPFHARYSEPHGGRIGAVRSPGVFDVLSRRNDLDRRQRADHRRAAGHRRSGAGRRRSRTRTSQGSRGGRPRRRLPDAVLRRRTRPPAARWPRGGRAAGAAVQVGRRDRRRGEEIRRRASRRRVDRRRLLREQHGFWRAVRRALARRCGRRPARRAAGVGLPHGVVQQRCARAGRDHRRYPGSGARRDSAPRGWFAAGHATRVGRRRPVVQGGAGARSEGARRGTAHGRRILLGGRCDLGTGRVGGACRRRHLHRRRPPRRARPPVQPRPLRRPPLLRRPTRPLRRRASPRPRDSLADAARAVDELGFQIHIHAIGDAAARQALDAIEHAVVTNGPRDRRPVIAHAQLVDDTDLDRFAALGVIPNMQPLWAQLDPLMVELTIPRLGPDRSDKQYRMHSLDESGAPLAFGSDWPVSSGAPLDGIAIAVSRGGWTPQELLTVERALTAYTAGVAKQAFAEGQWDTITPGASADLVWLDSDPRATPPNELADVRIRATYLSGRSVYTATG